MAAAYRVVVSSVSCYNSVVVDRRAHSHAVHYCSGPCGAMSQGLDCTMAHHGTCSELLIVPEPTLTDPSHTHTHSHSITTTTTHQLPITCKSSVAMDTGSNSGVTLERVGSTGNVSVGEDSPPWRGKKTPSVVGSNGTVTSSGSLKDITGEAINLASGKLKEFSFDKLRLSSSSHVTFRKGRKVRPDSFSRRSTDLDIIYGHFSSSITANGMANSTAASNDENLPPFGLMKGLEEAKLKGSMGSLSAVTKVGGGSTGSLSSAHSGSLDQGLNTVASLYLSTLGEENLFARLLEKTRGEGGAGGAGGEDIRACLDILLKCSEDLKKCTDIIKQCIRRKAPGAGGAEDGGASPESVYRAVMSRLSSYLRKLPLELEGFGGVGGGSQGAPGSGHSDLAELVNSLHAIQQGPFSPIFGNEQPPRYEDVVQSPPIPKTVPPSSTPTLSSSSSSSSSPLSSFSSMKTESSQNKPAQSSPSRSAPLTNGLQYTHALSNTQHTLSPPSFTHSTSMSFTSPTHSLSSLRTSPTPPYTHTPPASPMEALYIEEEADVGKSPEHTSLHTPTRGVTGRHSPINIQSRNGTAFKSHTHLSQSNTLQIPSSSTGYSPSWPSSVPTSSAAPKAVPHKDDDIDKLLMDLENLSQSMSHPRATEPPLPAKTRKRDGSLGSNSAQLPIQAPAQKPASHLAANGPTSIAPQGLVSQFPQGGNTEAGGGEEEDGALLLRILESIESFAQELVESGAGSAGSSERSSGKEREVMRLLQDTLATTGRPDSPHLNTPTSVAPTLLSIQASAAPTRPSKHTPVFQAVPAPVPAPAPPPPKALPVATPEPAPQAAPVVVPKPTPTPTPLPETKTDATPKITEASTAETAPTPIYAPAPPAPAPVSASLPASTHPAPPTPAVVPEAPAPVTVVAPVAVRDATVAAGDPVAVRDSGSTLLIQQSPEVIRVQSKSEKKPGTPPPVPSPAPVTPVPRSPSPPPAPVIVTPPPPSINIPRFYYPRGLPAPGPAPNHDAAITAIETAFTEFEEEKADIYEMGKIAKACGCPLYWKAPMFNAAGGERTGFVSVHSFIATWRKLLHSCHDDSSKFVYLLAKPSCNYLEQEDFIPLLQDIVDTHPGLTFLKDAPEFHSRYITTVIQRIFYVVNRSWTGRITMTELRRSNFLQTLALLEEEDDINQITDYFSYEHFYVIYCKFWELDTDHDLYIDPKDLARYNDHACSASLPTASSNRIIDRMFSGAVTRGNSVQREGRMSYAEFVWFLISEEDKKNPTSIEYWFRCMDVDGDGVLSMFELEYFYEEQCERMEGMGIEPLPFQDLLCQMLDLVKPESQGKITLGDLKRCRMAHIFFDTFFNLEKYLDHEQRDPFAVQKDIDSEGPEPSDWDKYAAEEYEILVAEETANEQLQEGSFDDDYESEELQVPGEIGNKMEKLVISDLSA